MVDTEKEKQILNKLYEELEDDASMRQPRPLRRILRIVQTQFPGERIVPIIKKQHPTLKHGK